jgi:hypothetical protein
MRARIITPALLSGALLTFSIAGAQTLPGTLPPAPQTPAAPPVQPPVMRPPLGVTPAPTTPAPAAPQPATALPGTPPPGAATVRYRGTIQEFDGPFLTLKTTDKKTVNIGITTATRLAHNRMLQLADLQPGWYIGIAALKSADGKTLRAQGIRVYPANARGTGEGAYPIDPANPARLLINGSVTQVAPGGIGGTLTLAFHGSQPQGSPVCDGKAAADGQGCAGAATIAYARGVPITAIEAGAFAQLLPAATISVIAAPDAGGTMVATAITIERDPPAKPEKPE